MEDINETKVLYPVVECVPAPEAIQGNGPAWEGQVLSRAEDHAVVGFQEPAEFRSKSVLLLPTSGLSERLPSARTARDPTTKCTLSDSSAKREGLNETGYNEKDEGSRLRCLSSHGTDAATLSPPLSPSNVENNSTTPMCDHSCFNGNRNAGGPEDANTLSGSPKAGYTTRVDASITDQLEEGCAASACENLQHTDADCDTDLSINNPDRDTGEDESAKHAASEQSLRRDGGIDDFQAVLQAAMRQSDAQRAQDRKSARGVRRFQQASPRQNSPVRQPGIGTPKSIKLETTASNNITSDCCGQDEYRQSDSAYVSNDSSGEDIESSRPSALTPGRELNNVKRQWIRYLSPEGYAYLYDEATGDSKWVLSREEEELSPHAQEPADATTNGVGHGGLGITGDGFGDQDEQKGLHGTASIKTEERDPTAYTAEGESVDTCEVSQWSQETSGPDAR